MLQRFGDCQEGVIVVIGVLVLILHINTSSIFSVLYLDR